jgi:2-polyprenyl-3-methyl-5-hydroxy-6-metoxy-1,4-benzoquinol methylase
MRCRAPGCFLSPDKWRDRVNTSHRSDSGFRDRPESSSMNERSFPTRPCPVCGSEKSELLLSYRFAAISDALPLDHYDLVICSECGCGYADDIPPQSRFDRYYRELSKYEYQHRGGLASSFDTQRFRADVDLMAPFIPSAASRILEIGCATGGLLAELRNRGFLKVTGMDPSPGCVQAARELYHLDVFAGTISDIPNHPHKYDFVILIGVVEHLRDAGAALSTLRQLLSPGGRLFVGVPDASRLPHVRNAPFQLFSVEHITYFSARSLQNLLATQGFDLVHTSQVIVNTSATTTDPLLSEIFEMAERPLPIVRDDQTEPALRQYIRTSLALAESRRPIIVWGTGAHTLRLLATSRLGEANVRFYVDSNPHYHGKDLNGVPVRAPSDIQGHAEPILISSWVYQDEIERQLREELMLPNERIVLYDL